MARCLLILLTPMLTHAQAGYDLPLHKPAAFENKTLASEKSTSTKNTAFRRFVQGTVTHYNYYFNAHQKILQVLARCREEHQDDLTRLISFYGYALEDTKRERIQLDSVIYKCTAGIVLHDLRNGWIDNLYLLIGQAFFLETKFDSADRILEFLNYHFYVKEEGDYHIPIGTGTQAKNGQVSIVNPENRKIWHEAFNRPPSRNDGLIWQVRSYTEQGKYAQAAGLISLLRSDPQFPPRLQPALAEQEAYWFYCQGIWDSTAVYLERALPNAASQADQARWDYLLAQLYELCHQSAAAGKWYSKAIEQSTDPRIDIYARLYRALLGQGNDKQTIPQTIAALLRLADRDRFAPFRDILYLSAARLALQQPDTTEALHFLDLSARNGGKGGVRNQAYLLMSDIGKTQGNYKIVATAYDSLILTDPNLRDQIPVLAKDKALYDRVLVSILRVEREDSLQRIAALPEAERTAFVKNLLHQLLKAQGVKEENNGNYYGSTGIRDSLNASDLFGTGNGEWYFYNQSARSSGSSDFQSRWGNRPNVDNWRRQSAMNTAGPGGVIQPHTTEDALTAAAKKAGAKPLVLTMDGLMSDLPLTPKALAASNDTVAYHLFRLGDLYKNEVGDNRAAVKVLEELYQRYPTYKQEEALYDLYVCYHLMGDEVKANYYLGLLHKRYPAAGKPAAPVKDTAADLATGRYKDIYDQFIAGNYDAALAEKKSADSLFGTKYWTPQLMYIQAVYYAHQRQDSSAIKVLNDLAAQFPKDPVTPRANKLKEVLGRRTQIETYLTNLKITRYKVDSLHIDTGAAVAVAVPAPPVAPPDLHRALGNRPDTLLKAPGAGAAALPGKSGLQVNNNAVAGMHSDNYLFDPSTPHYVLVVMTNVAGVYASEAKNAFSRYNQDVHYQEDIPIDTVLFQPGMNILKLGPFKNIVDALAYQFDLQKNAGKEIVPWLSADKYRFIVISQDNLMVLRNKKNLTEYETFINSYLKNMPATH
ncbi:type IX secretion system periplasmic lipoprotein PorW/SprE [Dinghuibacter silviterrae]|nr:tetratricopeptide repeat protein [Dinghuibacter silviterrae]